jgi:hypothetical protein
MADMTKDEAWRAVRNSFVIATVIVLFGLPLLVLLIQLFVRLLIRVLA